MFSVPIKMYIHRFDKNLEDDIPVNAHGSVLGGFISFSVYTVMLYYLSNLFVNLYSMNYDNINKIVGSNSFNNGDEFVNFSQTPFMPYINIK
jgi:hypothetical protein